MRMDPGLNGITLAQLNPIVGDLKGNAEKILRSWENAKDSDLIIFPELFLSGYPPEDLILRPAFLDAVESRLQEILLRSADFKAAALISLPWRMEGKTRNAALLVQNGEILAASAKHHLPNYGVFDELRVFEPAPLPAPLPFQDKKLGVMICEDMWFPDVAQHLKDQGADILIVPNASPFDSQKHNQRVKHARARVRETGLPLIYVNQVGGQDEMVFDGGSFVMDRDGNVVQTLKYFEEDTSVYCHSDRSAQRAVEESDCSDSGSDPSTDARDDNEDIYRALMLGLHDYVTKNHFPGVLIGLSGGVDSALSAAIAVDALGPDKVACVMMPSPFTSQNSLEDAKSCAEKLGVDYDVISIEDPMKAFERTIPALAGIAHENMQSRMRGLILMALSNASGKMVLSTGNKSEMAVGYATLYGDMCGGFNVLKDVYKTGVYDLCRWRNAQGPSPVIPERIITKAPTAELRHDQRDQDSLPPYEILDFILHHAIELQKSAAEIVALGQDRETVEKVLRLLDTAEYKRRQAPPGVKITNMSFGRERRYPMTNYFGK